MRNLAVPLTWPGTVSGNETVKIAGSFFAFLPRVLDGIRAQIHLELFEQHSFRSGAMMQRHRPVAKKRASRELGARVPSIRNSVLEEPVVGISGLAAAVDGGRSTSFSSVPFCSG